MVAVRAVAASVYTPTTKGFVAAENQNYNLNKGGGNLQTNASDTAEPSSPNTDPHWWDIKASACAVVIESALIPSELRLGM